MFRKYLLMTLVFSALIFPQRINKEDFKNLFGFVNEVTIKENLLQKDSAGYFYTPLLTQDQTDALFDKYYPEYIDLFAFERKDALLGALYSSISGIGLGLLESHAFGYQYPGLDKDGWLHEYLTMKTGGDQLIKLWHPNKVGRGMNDIFDRQAYKKWEKFFGKKWYLTYIVHFMVKNSVASIYRGWAKYDKPFFYYDLEIDYDWLIYRLFGE